MKKLMIVMSLLLGVSVVLLGGRSYAQYTQDNSYWETATAGMAPLSQGPAEGFDQAPQVSEFQAMTTEGLSAYSPASPESTMESAGVPSEWNTLFGGLNSFAPYSGK